jgi:uncharacterized phiE125 gp8 family phage protein
MSHIMNVKDLMSPAIEPVSLARVKLFLRVDHDNEDDLITAMIEAARVQVEYYCSVSLMTRARLLSFKNNAREEIIINHYPINNIEAVKLIDDAGVETLLTPAQYTASLRARPARLRVNRPSASTGVCHVEIEAVAGYGADERDIPAPFIQAILLLIAQFYERGETRPDDLPLMVQALLMPYRGVRL